MQDVIFNGTNKRKQAGIAQVTLTFENTKNLLPTAYNTVAISRLLYRSGESEYQYKRKTFQLFKDRYKGKAREKYIECYNLLRLKVD